MLRFYQGSFTSNEFDEMEVGEFNQYFKAMYVIESREMLAQITIADFPHYKESRRKDIFTKLKLGMQTDSNKAQSTQEIARMLGAFNG